MEAQDRRHALLSVRSRLRAGRCVLALALALTPRATAAADGAGPAPVPPTRPVVGLVLSGGGARGLAHIGLLTWLEENRIPVDRLAGTSMGGLVGGLYAMGMSPDEIRTLVRAMDWKELLRLTPRHDKLSYRRMEDQRKFPNILELGLKGGVKTPPGLSPGQDIGLLLDRLALPYAGLDSFDALPIPFRCVATDMGAGTELVMGSGDLASALRATMSMPSLFAPVEREERLLADGGLLDNLPVGVAEDMGAKFVIAVDIGTPLQSAEKAKSVFGMLNQAIGVMMIQTIRKNRERASVLIQPDLEGFGNMDFTKGDDAFDRGYAAAGMHAAELLKLALPEAEWQAHLASRRLRRRDGPPFPAPARVEARLPDPRAVPAVLRRFDDLVGKPLEPSELEARLTRLVGEGRFESAGYGLRPEPGGDVLDVLARPKTYGPPFLRLGLDIRGSRPEAVDFSFSTRLTLFDVGGYGSEWRNDFDLGNSLGLATEWYRPLGKGPFFVAPRARHQEASADVFDGSRRIAEYRLKRSGGGIDLGAAIGRTAEMRFGVDLSHVEAEVSIGDEALPSVAGQETIVAWRFGVDRQDSAVIPSRGLRATGEVRWLADTPDAPEPFTQIEAAASYFIPLGARSSFFLRAEAGASKGGEPPPPRQFTLGGPGRLSAYDPDAFRGNHEALGGVGGLLRLVELSPVVGHGLYGIVLLEAGSVFDGQLVKARFDGSLGGGLVADTNLGALLLGYAVGDDGSTNFFFSLGRLF